MSNNKRWNAYNIKHPEKYQTKEIECISNKFKHTKKIKVKAKKE
jgi:hypothetical protein